MRGFRDWGVASALAAAVLAVGASPAAAAPVPVSTGHSGWTWGAPSPQGQDLAAVAFDGATGYAVGAFGTVVRSADSGLSWTGLASATTDSLSLVQELSPSTVVVGGGCTASESTDSGSSFQQLPLGLDEACSTPVTGLAFSDAQHGYVELSDGTMMYTADGGQTVQAKTAAPVGDRSATALAFTSPTTGVAVSNGGLIDRTTDAANSWTQTHNAPRPLNGVTFVTPSIAYAVGDRGELLRSDDGGASWSMRPLQLPAGGPPPDLTHITCADASDCLISTSNGNELVRTSDGGATGSVVSVSNRALNDAAFSTGADVVGVGHQGATAVSQNGGETFSSVSLQGLASFQATPGTQASLRAGGAPGLAYMAGGDGTIAATVNRGASWQELKVPTGASIEDVAFPTRSIGFALDAQGTLRRTDNGGVSWRSFAAGHSTRSALLSPTASVQLLVGPRGVFRATDGGANFHKVPGRVRAGRSRGAPVDSLALTHALAVGGRVVAWGPSGIFVSSDTGRSWRQVPSPVSPRSLGSVSLVGSSRLWALSRAANARSSRLFQTSDGGRHWRELQGIGKIAHGQMVSFADANDGIMSVDSSPLVRPFAFVSVLSTHDGGRTWEPQVVAGEAGGFALATPSADYSANAYDPTVYGYFGFFATRNGGASPRRSTLRVALAQRSVSAAALARAGHSVVLRGHVTPVLRDGQPVIVSYTSGGGEWSTATARVASSGAFRVRLSKIRSTTAIVAQSVGDGRYGGAGTPVLHLRVTR